MRPTKGVDALNALERKRVLAEEAHFAAARSLIADISDALGETPQGVTLRGREHPALSRGTHRRARVLRNL